MKTMKIVLSLIFVYLLVNCLNLINQEFRLQNYRLRLDEDMKKVQAEQLKLKKDLHYYSTSAGVEELARKRLGYYKKGEIPMRVIETPQESEQVASVSPELLSEVPEAVPQTEPMPENNSPPEQEPVSVTKQVQPPAQF